MSGIVSQDLEPSSTDEISVEQELELEFQSLANLRAEIYKNMTDLDVLGKKADEASRKVSLQCSDEHDNDADALPFYMEAFQEQWEHLESGRGGIVHCFPAAHAGLLRSSESSKKTQTILSQSKHVSVKIEVKDLFSS